MLLPVVLPLPETSLTFRKSSLQKNPLVKITFQQSGVTLAQLLATPTTPRTQTPLVPTANAPVVTQAAPATVIATIPT